MFLLEISSGDWEGLEDYIEDEVVSPVNQFFLVIMAIVIFLMQAGFAFLEAGSVRSKNTTSILMKNALDACVGALLYWAVGYAFSFGGSDANPVIGYTKFFLAGIESDEYAFFFFEFVFAATSGTIISGAVAERCSIFAYVFVSTYLTGIVYPIVVHWAWFHGGWMKVYLDYIDFAGSGVVHITGGTASLVGAIFVGPRIGRFDENGKPLAIPGHSTVLSTLGFFILWFGFYAFNGGSGLGVAGDDYDPEAMGRAVVSTTLSAIAAALSALLYVRMGFKRTTIKLGEDRQFKFFTIFGGYWSLLALINGGITGMVAICAGANAVQPWGAICIGAIAGVLYCVAAALVERVRIDDPLNAVAVHLFGGFWGVIAVAIFCASHRIDTLKKGGILYTWNGDAWLQLGKQACCGASIFVWTLVTTALLFAILRLSGRLRVSEKTEEEGLDLKEGEPAYPIDPAMISIELE